MAEQSDDKQNGVKKLADLIDDLDDQVDGQDSLSVGDILDAFGTRAFGPLMALPGLVMVTPLGGIPGMPVIVAAFIVLIAAQHLFGRDHPWLPKKLTNRSVSKDKWDKTRSKVRPWAKRVDWLLRPRLQVLAGRVMERVISIVIIVLAISMIPIGFIPFAVAAPGAAILLFGLALSARDGVVVILGLLATGVSGYLVWTTVF
ncbi:MAG: exopolysaccharide biosynthesis protein [Phycisphaerales bacterium JB064]